MIKFLINCVKLTLKVWIGQIIIALILLPLEIMIFIFIFNIIKQVFFAI